MAKLRNQELPDGVKVLYSVDANGKVNYSKELRRLNRKLMDKFVEVLRNSTQSADATYEAQAKTIIEEMDLIFINMTQVRIRIHTYIHSTFFMCSPYHA